MHTLGVGVFALFFLLFDFVFTHSSCFPPRIIFIMIPMLLRIIEDFLFFVDFFVSSNSYFDCKGLSIGEVGNPEIHKLGNYGFDDHVRSYKCTWETWEGGRSQTVASLSSCQGFFCVLALESFLVFLCFFLLLLTDDLNSDFVKFSEWRKRHIVRYIPTYLNQPLLLGQQRSNSLWIC